MIRDPHDKRDLRLWAQCDDDGNVVSTHEIDASVETPDLRHPIELTSVGVDQKQRVALDLSAAPTLAILKAHAVAVKLAVAKAASESIADAVIA